MDRSAVGLRERKKAATRESLRAATVRLCAERGYERVTVEDIAEAADVSPRTFFNYFACKEDAVVGFDPEMAASLREAVTGQPEELSSLEALLAVLSERAAVLAEHADAWKLRMDVLHDNPALLPRHIAAFATFERSLAEGVAERAGLDIDGDAYPGLCAAAAASAFRFALTRWHDCGQSADVRTYLAEAFALLAGGLA